MNNKGFSTKTNGFSDMMDWYDRIQSKIDLSLESYSINTRFGQTHIIAVGGSDKPSIILIQGLGGNAMLWEPQLVALSREYRIYAIDVIGQMGKSDNTWLSYKDDSFSYWLLDILNGLGIDKANIAGISFGARIVMRFSCYAPQRVNRLALLSPIGISRQRMEIITQILPLGINLFGPSDAIINNLVHSIFDVPGQLMNSDCEEALNIIFKNYRPVSGIRKIIDGMALFLTLPEKELRRITVPTLLFVGEYERLCNPQEVISRGKRLLPLLQKCELVSGAGHVMNYDRPEYINAQLSEFFKGVH